MAAKILRFACLILIAVTVLIAGERAMAQATSAPTSAPAAAPAKLPFDIKLPDGWTRAQDVQTGFEVGYTKKIGDGEARFLVHSQFMGNMAKALPEDTSEMQRQFDVLIRQQFSDARSFQAEPLKPDGKVIMNLAYDLSDQGKSYRRRYMYILNQQTALVVMCDAPPAQFAQADEDFRPMLCSLRQSGEPQTGPVPLASAVDAAKNGVSTMVNAYPSDWQCAIVDVRTTNAGGKTTLEVGVAFARPDVGEIFKACKIVMTALGNGDPEPQVSVSAQDGGAFMQYVGQIWGCVYSFIAQTTPPVDEITIVIMNASRTKVGTLSVLRTDAEKILSGQLNDSDSKAFGKALRFE
jgi:hypothetical protein